MGPSILISTRARYPPRVACAAPSATSYRAYLNNLNDETPKAAAAQAAINLQQLLADHGGEIPGTALPDLYQKSFGAPLYPKGTKLKVALQSWPLSDVCEIDLRPCLNGPPLMAVLSKNSSPSTLWG